MADPKESRDGALDVGSSVAGPQRSLSEVEGLGFHTREHNASLPYGQARTTPGTRKITGDTICQLRRTRVALRPTGVDRTKGDHRGVSPLIRLAP
jgi:hypothetical protein